MTTRRRPRGPAVALIALALVVSLSGPAAQAQNGLQQLLEEVRQDRARQAQRMREREAQFLERRDQARQRLAEVRQQREQAEAEAARLSAGLDRIEAELREAQAAFADEAGDLQQLGQINRLIAAELRDRLLQAPTRIDRPQRQAQLDTLAEAEGLPSPEDVRTLWDTMLDDMALSAGTARLQRPVSEADGRESNREVLRLGGLQVVSGGDYLQFLPASGALLVSPRQPPPAVRALAAGFQSGDAERIALDPTQGQALRLAGQDRNWRQALRDAGIVGYLIIALATVGVLISIERLLMLVLTRRRLLRQRAGASTGANALARLQAVRTQAADTDTETLGLKLDEAVLRELPRLRRGLSTLAVIGASAPLLGLLGTVAGMIQTFQVISVFGNGDPQLMSAGISQALVTTELGLLAAIPILLLHSYLNSQSNQLVQILDEESARMLAEFSEQRHGLA